MSLFYKFSKALYQNLFKYLWNGEIINAEEFENWENGIIAANHLHWSDPPLVGSVIPGEINFLTKKELLQIPVLGFLIKKLNTIPIRRGTIDRNATNIVIEKLLHKQSVLIFPEGSRKNFTAKPGIGKLAITAQAPILPVYVRNSTKLFSCFLRINKLSLIYGKPISVEEINKYPDSKEGYRNLACYILDRINGLKNDN